MFLTCECSRLSCVLMFMIVCETPLALKSSFLMTASSSSAGLSSGSCSWVTDLRRIYVRSLCSLMCSCLLSSLFSFSVITVMY